MVNENETLFDQIKTQAITQVLASENQPESEVKFQCLEVGEIKIKAFNFCHLHSLLN